MPTAAAYIRVSTDEQTEYSPAVQLDEILSFAQKNGFSIPPEFVFSDEGISGRSAEKRPAFQSMIRQARKKSNHIEAVIVHKFDRFARSKQDAVLYKALLKKDGVKVISVKEPIPQDDKFAVIYESMLEAMAEYYSLNLAEEVKKTMSKKAAMGEYQAHAPFGYRNADKTLVIEPEQAKIVLHIFRQYAAGQSIFRICQGLNEMHCLTNRRRPFDTRAVSYILHNPVYKGFARWTPSGPIDRRFDCPDTVIAKGDWPPIVPLELWESAAARLKKYNVPAHSRFETEGRHWLSGMVKCSACGKSLVFSASGKPAFTLQCGGYTHGKCAVSHSLSSRALLSALYAALEEITFPPCRFSARPKGNKGENAALLDQAIAKAKQRLENAKAAFLDGIDSLAEYKKNKASLLESLQILEQQKDAAAPQQDATVSSLSLPSILNSDAFSLPEKRAAFRSCAEKIIFRKAERSITLILTQE